MFNVCDKTCLLQKVLCLWIMSVGPLSCSGMDIGLVEASDTRCTRATGCRSARRLQIMLWVCLRLTAKKITMGIQEKQQIRSDFRTNLPFMRTQVVARCLLIWHALTGTRMISVLALLVVLDTTCNHSLIQSSALWIMSFHGWIYSESAPMNIKCISGYSL